MLLEYEPRRPTPESGVVLGPPDWSFCVTLQAHPATEQQGPTETGTAFDQVSFRVANRFRLEALANRLTELGVDHDPIKDLGTSSVLAYGDPDDIRLELIAFA